MTENIRVIGTKQAPAAVGPYSQAMEVKSESLVFISGQLGLVPESGDFAGPDFPSQAKQALANVAAVLEAAGCSLRDVAAVDVFMTDLKNFGIFNEIYGAFFGDHKPARAAVEVSGLPKGGLVEVKAIARKNA